MLDIKTIIFIGVLTDIICTLMIVGLWRQDRKRYDGMGFWVVDFSFQTASFLLIILRGSIPDWMSMVLSNTLVLSGAVLGFMGLERFLGKKGPQLQNYILLAIFPLVQAYFVYIQPNLAARTIIISAVLGIICFQCVWLLLRRVEAPLRPLTQWVGVVFGAYVLICALRIATLIFHPLATNDFFHSGASEALILVAFQMLFILLTYALTLMVNKRLLMGIQSQEEKFSKAFHSSPYAMSLTRMSDGKIIEVNDGFANISGYPPAEILGKTSIDLDLWANPQDRESLMNGLQERGRIHGLELRFKNKSGGVVTCLFSADTFTINNEKCILSSINDISERKRAEEVRERLIVEREKALSEVKVLSGMLPICASCKKIRDDKGYWNQIETYIRAHSEAKFTHGLCPECMETLYPGVMDSNKTTGKDPKG